MKPVESQILEKLQAIKTAISASSPEASTLDLGGLERSLGPYEYKLILKLLNIKTAIEEGGGGGSAVEVEDITALTKEQLDALKPGDIVEKVTGSQKHTYIVSYKGDGAGEGICLTYCDAGYSETVSYDRSGDDWQYNSTDIVSVPTKTSDLTNDSSFVDGTDVSHIVKITQEAYDLLDNPDPATIYAIIEEEPLP